MGPCYIQAQVHDSLSAPLFVAHSSSPPFCPFHFPLATSLAPARVLTLSSCGHASLSITVRRKAQVAWRAMDRWRLQVDGKDVHGGGTHRRLAAAK